MYIADRWQDYQLLDAGAGEKLERWGDYLLRRPDPQAIWPPSAAPTLWAGADAHYVRDSGGGGAWRFLRQLPDRWQIGIEGLRFHVRPTGFKHTGLFPEQAVNWLWMNEVIRAAARPIRVLNLFAYTGGATLACLKAGACVCHVDAAKAMVGWARENAALSGLSDRPARYIVEDCQKFVQREQRRGNLYEAIVMDPPSYGRGPDGQMWKLEDQIFSLLADCEKILSDKPLFVLLNAYTTGLQPLVLQNLLRMALGNRGGRFDAQEVALPISESGLLLPCGASGRWQA